MLLMPAAQAPQVGVSTFPLVAVSRLNPVALQSSKLCSQPLDITLSYGIEGYVIEKFRQIAKLNRI